VRIPLDYYRILGVPPQASLEQLAQAYQDRSKQLPRKEHSTKAILARRQLLEQAYHILKDPLAKVEYDQEFLSLFNPEDPISVCEACPRQNSLDFQPSPYLEIPSEQVTGALVVLQELAEYEQVIEIGENFLKNHNKSINSPTDILGSMALAQLELSREQWQQKNYEQASLHGQKGLDLLKTYQVLPSIQAEIESELAKLVPYRILNIFSGFPLEPEERVQGIKLLEQVLEKRQGIEGTGNDRSGLDLSNFLRFIQQLRPLLTSQEQKNLFSIEYKIPSSAALYLLVYTLIAQGFSQKKPSLIYEAYQKLNGMAQIPDVIIEKSICALLLGQTESALEQIQNCQEPQILEVLQKPSQNAEDLLPRLCWYAEYWLKFEVMPHFLDLLNYPISLNEYFADKNVQKYIEELTDSPECQNFSTQNMTTQKNMLTQRQLNHSSATKVHRSTTSQPKQYEYTEEQNLTISSPAPESEIAFIATRSPTRRRKRRKRVVVKPGRLLLALTLLGLGIGSLLFAWNSLQQILNKKQHPTIPGLEGEQLYIKLDEPTIKQHDELPPTPKEQKETSLTEDKAKILLEDWLKTKSEALGQNHQIDNLNHILAQPILAIWQERAKDLQEEGEYKTFKHQIKISSVKMLSETEAQVQAQIKEKTNYYQKNKIETFQEDLVFQYNLKKEGERWLIYNSTQLK